MVSLIDLFYGQAKETGRAHVDQQSIPRSEHWSYRVWSRLLDAEVWWVHCDQEVKRLLQKEAGRGVIYTETELKALLSLPQEDQKDTLVNIHRLKLYFDGTVIGEERHEHHDNR